MEKRILVVTHEEKEPGIPNPGLTEEGKEKIKSLNVVLCSLDSIFCGTGRRFLETAETLGVKPDGFLTALGTADTNFKKPEGQFILLADGTEVPAGQYYETVWRKNSSLLLLGSYISKYALLDFDSEDDCPDSVEASEKCMKEIFSEK